MDIKPDFLPNPCMGCLSVGLKLSYLIDDKLKSYFMEIVKEVPLFSYGDPNPILCWDCEGMLQRVVKFRQQVADSYRIIHAYNTEDLQQYLKSEVFRLPRLKTNSVAHVDISPQESDQRKSVDIVIIKEEMTATSECFYNAMEEDHLEIDTLDALKSETDDVPVQTVNEDTGDAGKICSSSRRGGSSKIKKENGRKSSKKKSQKKKRVRTVNLTFEELMKQREAEWSSLLSEFKCESCVQGFTDEKSMMDHRVKEHSKCNGEHVCAICQAVMESSSILETHYKKHFVRYECTACKQTSTDRQPILEHYQTTHEDKTYSCETCGKDALSRQSLRYHSPCQRSRVQCPECDKTFRHRAGLVNHRLTVHKLKNSFPCEICKKVFKWKASLKKHQELHNGPPQSGASCVPCGVSFSSASSLKRHLANSLRHVTHDQLRFVCDHCNRKFANKTKLRDHIEEKHLKRTFSCHICKKPSKNRVCLEQHVRNVHRGRPHDKVCHHCGKGFPTKVQLESHIRSHTGERPFICERCPTTFSQQSNLYKHNRQVHLNAKSKRYSTKRKDQTPGAQSLSHLSTHSASSELKQSLLMQYHQDKQLYV